MMLNSVGLPILIGPRNPRGGRHKSDKPVDQIVDITEGSSLQALAVNS
jgi:hypothetical protein